MRYDETLIKDEVFELFAWEDSQFKEFKHKILLPVAVKVAYLSASFFKNSSNSLNRIQLSQFVSLLNYLASAKKIQSVEETTRAILTFMAWQSIEYTSSYSRPNRHNHVNDLYAAIPGVTLQCASHANPNFFRLVKKLLRSNFSYGSAKKDLSAQISTIWQQTEFKRLAGEVSIRQIRYAQDDSKRCDAENSYSLRGLQTVYFEVENQKRIKFFVYAKPQTFSSFLANKKVSAWVPTSPNSLNYQPIDLCPLSWDALRSNLQNEFASQALEDETATKKVQCILGALSAYDRNLLKSYFLNGGK